MIKKAKRICLWAGIVILVITAIIANVWRPLSNIESGIVVFFSFSFIITAMLLQTIQNRDKNIYPSLFIGKLIAVIFTYLNMLWETVSRFF